MARNHHPHGLASCLAVAISALHACGLVDTDATGSVAPDPALTRITSTGTSNDDPPTIPGGRGFYRVWSAADDGGTETQFVSMPYGPSVRDQDKPDYPIQLAFRSNGVVELNLIRGEQCPEDHPSFRTYGFFRLATLFPVPRGQKPIKVDEAPAIARHYNLTLQCPLDGTQGPEWYVDNTGDGWWKNPGRQEAITKLSRSPEQVCEGPRQWLAGLGIDEPDEQAIRFVSRTEAHDALTRLPDIVQAFVKEKMQQMIEQGCGPVIPTTEPSSA